MPVESIMTDSVTASRGWNNSDLIGYSHRVKTDPEGMESSKNISKKLSLKSSPVIVCLATVILFNVFTVVEGKSCSMLTQYTIVYPDNLHACRTCKKCPVGHGLPIQCGRKVSHGTSTDCIPCPTNTYSITNDATACKPCHECDGKKVEKECTPTRNRECGTTCLEPNYYLDSNNDECKECYSCCEDVPDSEKLQQCKDIGMPVNRQCKKTHENEQCKLKATKPATDVNKTEVNNNTFDLESPSKQSPAPIYDDNKNNSKGSPPTAGADYKGFYILGAGVLGGICLVAITVKIYRSRRPSQQDGNREDTEQDEGHEMSVVVHGPESTAMANSSNADRSYIERAPTLENNIPEGVMLNDFPYYGEDFILKLDITSAGVKNWCHVACKFSVPTLDVQMIEQQGRNNPSGSPTRALIAKLCTQNVSLKRFVEILQELDRNDVANDILKWYSRVQL